MFCTARNGGAGTRRADHAQQVGVVYLRLQYTNGYIRIAPRDALPERRFGVAGTCDPQTGGAGRQAPVGVTLRKNRTDSEFS